MPIYEYLCSSCGHQLEALQRISDEPLKFCPECGVEDLKKKVSAVGFRLKGTGWYETDFKNSSKGKEKAKESKNSAKPKDAGNAGDTKSGATKTESKAGAENKK